MPKLDRYLSSEIARSVLAALVVLSMVSMGGLFADLLGEMARGKVPPTLLMSQLGLRLIRYLPLILPLALLLGYLMALGRMYRDSEMYVLAALGVGPRRMLRPVLLVALPAIAGSATSSTGRSIRRGPTPSAAGGAAGDRAHRIEFDLAGPLG